MFTVNYLLSTYCIYQGFPFLFSLLKQRSWKSDTRAIKVLKSSPKLDVIPYVALSILNSREGHGFIYSNKGHTSIPLTQCLLWK